MRKMNLIGAVAVAGAGLTLALSGSASAAVQPTPHVTRTASPDTDFGPLHASCTGGVLGSYVAGIDVYGYVDGSTHFTKYVYNTVKPPNTGIKVDEMRVQGDNSNTGNWDTIRSWGGTSTDSTKVAAAFTLANVDDVNTTTPGYSAVRMRIYEGTGTVTCAVKGW
jgi:hypothetical protein